MRIASPSSRDLHLRQRHDAAAGRRHDEAADHQQHPQRPFHRAGAAEVADKGLITLDAAADEHDAEAGQPRQPERLEIGIAVPAAASAGFSTKKNGMK